MRRVGEKEIRRETKSASTSKGSQAQSDLQRMIVRLEVAIGEALFASTLATLTLTSRVAAGRLTHDEAQTLLDGAMLVLERHRGADPDSAGAVDYARSRLAALLKLLEQMQAKGAPRQN
jgi:hypothetical protein